MRWSPNQANKQSQQNKSKLNNARKTKRSKARKKETRSLQGGTTKRNQIRQGKADDLMPSQCRRTRIAVKSIDSIDKTGGSRPCGAPWRMFSGHPQSSDAKWPEATWKVPQKKPKKKWKTKTQSRSPWPVNIVKAVGGIPPSKAWQSP